MRGIGLGLLLALLVSATAFAQTESSDQSDQPTNVVVQQEPPTYLDKVDRMEGLVTKGLTLAGTVNDEIGGKVEVYAVVSKPDDASKAVARGLAFVVTRKDGQTARAYVDEGKIEETIDAVKVLASIDRGATPMLESRGIYRMGNLAVYNIDDNGGRFAIVRALAVSPITGQATFAASRFRANRLNELVRYLQIAKDALDKGK